VLRALNTQARDDRDAGFTLIEILVAMVLMAIVMSSLAVFFIGAQSSSAELRLRQNATVVADQAMDKVHSIETDKLLYNRDKTSSDAQWAAPVVGVDLSGMSELWDTTTVPTPSAGTGTNATVTPLPTVPQVSTVNKTNYSVSTYIGRCWIPRGGGSCTLVPTADPVQMDRVIVAVNWTDTGNTCPLNTCAYVIASLISPTSDPTFNVNQVLIDTTPPSTPTLGSCAPTGSFPDVAIKLNAWSPSTDASGVARYDIYRGTSSTFSLMTKVGTSTTPADFTDSGLTPGLIPGTTYYYAVVALDTVGNQSGPQVPVGTVTNPQQPPLTSCTTAPDTFAPSAPGAPTASTPTTNGMVVTWPAGSDEYQVGGYELFRQGVTAPIATTGATTLTFTDSGLLPWTNYQYYVKTVDTAGNVSAASPLSTAVRTLDSTPPTTPASLVATPKPWPALEIDLDWADSTDNVAVTGYNIWRSPDGTTWAQIGTSTTSNYADTTVATSKTYYYKVLAYDAVPNLSGYSNVASASTPDTTPPSNPTGLAAPTKTPTTLGLTWTASTDNVGVTGYYVYRNGGTTPVGTVAGTSFTDTGLTQLTGYTYTVKAFDAAGNVSLASTILSTSTTDGLPPTSPTLSSSSKTMTTVTLNWTTATDNVGVTGYAIYRNGGTTPIATTLGTVFTYVDNAPLSPNTTYTYTVKAYDAAGNYSAASNTLSVTTVADTTAPATVTGVKGTATGLRAVLISWNTDTDNVAVAGYKVYWNGVLGATVLAPNVSVPFTGLVNSSTNTIVVYAYDTSNNLSAASATLTCNVSSSGTVTCP